MKSEARPGGAGTEGEDGAFACMFIVLSLFVRTSFTIFRSSTSRTRPRGTSYGRRMPRCTAIRCLGTTPSSPWKRKRRDACLDVSPLSWTCIVVVMSSVVLFGDFLHKSTWCSVCLVGRFIAKIFSFDTFCRWHQSQPCVFEETNVGANVFEEQQ